MYVSKENLVSFVNSSNLDQNELEKNGLRYIDAEENLFILVKNDKNNDSTAEEANGIIFEKNTKKIVCTNQNNFKKIENNKKISEFPANSIFEYIEDGTVIRLYFNKIWKTATSRCSDAKYSFWSSDLSFDEQFWEIFDKRDLTNLDKRNTYIFILRHQESERVVKIKKNELVFVCSISNINGFENINYFKTKPFTNFKRPNRIPRNWKTLKYFVTRHESIAGPQEDGMFTFEEKIKNEIYELSVPLSYDESFEPDFKTLLNDKTAITKRISSNDSIDENVPIYIFNLFNNRLKTLETLEDYSHPFKRGILIKVPQENNTYVAYQYDFDQYKKIDEMRGNVPTLDDRFLELYLQKNFKTLKALENYYHKSSKTIKKSLIDLYKTIFDLYIKTHKLHQLKVDETNKYYTTLKQIHAIFYKKNKTNDIHLEQVKEKLEKISNEQIYIPELETIPEGKVLDFSTPNPPPPTSDCEKKMVGITYMDVVNHINSLNYSVVKKLM